MELNSLSKYFLKLAANRNRAKYLAIILTFELFCTVNKRIADACFLIYQANTCVQISDKVVLIDAVAITKRIAIKKDIPCNSTAINTGK